LLAATDYLEQGLGRDRAELEHVRELIDETAATLLLARSGTKWPYVVREGQRDKPVASVSTNTMIAFALAATAGRSLTSPLAPDPPAEDMLGERSRILLGGDRAKAARTLDAILTGVVRAVVRRKIFSGTYGPNDPFTLGWLAPLVATFELAWPGRNSALRQCFRRAWAHPENRSWTIFEPPPPEQALSHAFPLLRIVHLSKTVDALSLEVGQTLPPECEEEFDATVHRQLANSTITDASFDAAELIFAFEGLLRVGVLPSEALANRFFEAVAASQELSPSWRPLRPFIGTDRGLVLLPLSIEAASSLARICGVLDARRDRGDRFTQHIGLFGNYVQWLVAQRVHIAGRELHGWHSEHVREARAIYTWQTSQVLVFLLLYAELLQRHIAEQALAAANLSVKYHPERAKGDPESWRLVRDTFVEPAAAAGRRLQTKNRSAVLFGPPGTGKTTLAEWLAAELEWPFITITPSDFMAEGTAAVEARAKAVFTALLEQRRVVVVFDEIDRLILDRELPEYHRQEGAFQLMTPSMLTKLNDLRRPGRVIFLVATNFVERIDPAITRPGRFDAQLAILPPAASERKEFLEKRWKDKTRRSANLDHVVARAWFASYAELIALVRDSTGVRDLRNQAAGFEPAISLESYASRMDGVGRKPSEEVLGLAERCPPGAVDGVARNVIDAAEDERRANEARRRRRAQSSGTA
jgi:hypothetical protein